MQNTRFDNLLRSIEAFLRGVFYGPWKTRSLSLISLLLGFYIGSNVIIYYLDSIGQRPIVVLLLVISVEILVRLRSNIKSLRLPNYWLAIDNLRIGFVYALVLEAFKLGS